MTRICFEEMFEKTKGKRIEYNGKTLYLAYYYPVSTGDIFSLKIEKCNSNWKQGVALKIYNGTINIEKNEFPKGIVVWENSSSTNITFSAKTHKNKKAQLEIKNVWDTGNGCMESWHNGAAIYIEDVSHNIKRFWCNDGYPDDDLNDIVFTIQKIT